MSSVDLTTNAGRASIAYSNALESAKHTQNALLRQYGFTMPDASGQYTLESAQSAFDPNTLFNQATGGVDEDRLKGLAARLQAGGTGILGDISRGGASAEAEAVLGSRASGITGGLAAQRRSFVEAQTSGQLGRAREEFVAGIGSALSPIGGAFQDLQVGRATDQAQMDADRAARESMVAPEAETAASVSGKPALGTGPTGDFMKKMTNISKSKNKRAQVNNLKSIKQNYSLSAQQKAYIDSFLKRLGG